MRPYGNKGGANPSAAEDSYDSYLYSSQPAPADAAKPAWPILDCMLVSSSPLVPQHPLAFVFEDLQPTVGREGDMCSCLFRFGKVDKDVNIGFGLLFGAAVPTFEEDMETEVDCVRIKFRIPPLACLIYIALLLLKPL
jgi:hypothetical protein